MLLAYFGFGTGTERRWLSKFSAEYYTMKAQG
jgi:hypothetical protein